MRRIVILLLCAFVLLMNVGIIFAQCPGPDTASRTYNYTRNTCGPDEHDNCYTEPASGVWGPPSMTLNYTCSTGFKNNNWCNGTVTLTANAQEVLTSDTAHGAPSAPSSGYGITGIRTPTGDKNTASITISYTDNGLVEGEFCGLSAHGDTTIPQSVSFHIDNKKPVVENIIITGDMKNGWYYGAVTVTVTGTDEKGEIANYFVDYGNGEVASPTTIPNTFSGIITIKAKAVDKAGNESDWKTFDAIKIDNEKPTITDPKVPSNEWSNQPIEFAMSGTDAYSGIAEAIIVVDDADHSFTTPPYRVSPHLTDGIHTVTYRLIDNVGNESLPSGPHNVKYDVTLPFIQLESGISLQTVNGKITFRGTVNDAASGLKKVMAKYGESGTWELATGQPALYAKTGDWSHTVTSGISEGFSNFYFTSVDAAGNESSELRVQVVNDNTPPECHVELSGLRGAGGSFRGNVTITAVCTDATTGVKQTWVDIGNGKETQSAVYKSTASAKVTPIIYGEDNAGNNTGAIKDFVMYHNGKIVDELLIDNTKPVVTSAYQHGKWVKTTDPITLFAKGTDKEGDIFSVVFSIDGVEYEVKAVDNYAELEYTFPEGITNVYYYVKDKAGNESPLFGLVENSK